MAIEATEPSTALIQNDIVLFGLIAATLGLVFWLASGPTPFWKKFFTWVPALLLCYFIPGIYNSVGLIDGNASKLYNPIASRVLLPAALLLLPLTLDLTGVPRLGSQLLRKTQSGYLYHYAFAMIVGLILLLGVVIRFWQ